MEWKTRVTELLGCKYPIMQGAMAGLGNWKFAAAVANAGGHGILTASVSRTPEKLREDIKRCREASAGAPGTFGVNLTLAICPRIEEMLEVCIEERVHVETAAYKPDSLAPRIKQGAVTWIHKTARVKDAVHAEKLGADAVIVVGLEGIGFKNPEQLPTLTTTIWAKREIKVPFIAAGGIGDARGFLGALGMGADGVMMGTAFMATKECPLKASAKEAMIQARPDNAQLRHRVLDTPDAEAYAEVMKMRDQLPLEKWLPMLERVNLKDPDWRKTPRSVEPSARELGTVVSLAVASIDRVSTVKELIDGIIQGAEDLLDSFPFLKTR